METALWGLEGWPRLPLLPRPQPLLLMAPFTWSIFTFPLFLLQDQRKEGRLKEAVVCPALCRRSEKADLAGLRDGVGPAVGWGGAQAW